VADPARTRCVLSDDPETAWRLDAAEIDPAASVTLLNAPRNSGVRICNRTRTGRMGRSRTLSGWWRTCTAAGRDKDRICNGRSLVELLLPCVEPSD